MSRKAVILPDLVMGKRYLFVPTDSRPAPVQGVGRPEFPADGAERLCDSYLYGCVRRGSLSAYEEIEDASGEVNQ